jgi:integrase
MALTKITGLLKQSDFSITYSELINEYVEHLKQLEKSEQIIKNMKSVIKLWVSIFGFSEQTPVGEEMSLSFKDKLNDFSEAQSSAGILSSTYRPRLSNMKKVRIYYLNRAKQEILPETFSERLDHLLLTRGFSQQRFWKTFLEGKINSATFDTWFSGAIPSNKHLPIIEIIEKALQLPDKTLIDALPKSREHSLPPTGQTSYGRRLIESRRKPYYAWPTKLEEQFAKYCDFKSAVITPDGMKRGSQELWTSTEGDNLPTAEIVKTQFRSFFGFCLLPVDSKDPMLRGAGLRDEDLSFALLSDKDLVEAYVVQFHKSRAGGKFNSGATNFLTTVMALLREKVGYLYQKPNFGAELRVPIARAKWQKHCLKTLDRLQQLYRNIRRAKKSGSSDYEIGRDVSEQIAPLLSLPRPIHATLRMAKDMIADIDKIDARRYPVAKTLLCRDALLVSMIQANPLRIRMFSTMQFKRHLYQKTDGSWHIRFKRTEFKNRHSLWEDYEVPVTAALWSLINIYRDEYRPKLKNSADCEYVFLSGPNGRGRTDSNPSMSEAMLSIRILARTYQYLPNCSGFRAHAFRHIVATDIVRSDPLTGISQAAKVLHDKPATVDRAYAHIKTAEYFAPYNASFEEAWKEA